MADGPPPYVAIIDAGSSSSRMFIYKWEPVQEITTEPLRLEKIYPNKDTRDSNVAEGGMVYIIFVYRQVIDTSQAFRRCVTLQVWFILYSSIFR